MVKISTRKKSETLIWPLGDGVLAEGGYCGSVVVTSVTPHTTDDLGHETPHCYYSSTTVVWQVYTFVVLGYK